MPEGSIQKRCSQKKPGAMGRSKDILRALLDPTQPDTVPWSSSDLQAILNHQMATPLTSELDQLSEIAQLSREETSIIIESYGYGTFGDLLWDHSPSERALRMFKGYVKQSLTKEGYLPRDVARVLYVTVILRGRQAGIGDITSLDEVNLKREARRCLTFGWLPDGIRELLRGCVLDKR